VGRVGAQAAVEEFPVAIESPAVAEIDMGYRPVRIDACAGSVQELVLKALA